VGGILVATLLYSSMTDSVLTCVNLLTGCSMGIWLPLFVTALAIDSFLNYFKKIKMYMYSISMASGVFLVLVGVMLYTNSLTLLTSALERHGIGWYIGQ